VSFDSTLHALVPNLLEQRIASAGDAARAFWFERVPAVALIADLSGFTNLAERLAAKGPAGAEELSRLINIWFGSMVDQIAVCGGDIIRFAGDAPIVMFPVEASESIDECLARATACGHLLQQAVASNAAGNVNLALRVGIGSGEITTLTVGGIEDRWEFVVGGPPLDDMSEALRTAGRGDIVVGSVSEGGRRSSGHTTRDFVVPLVKRPTAAALDDRMLRPFVPRTVLRFIDAGQSAWTAELRPVTVVFITVHGIDLEAPAGPATLQRVFAALQTSVYESGGSITQFLVDDKGTTLVSVWGLPGETHEDDAVRAAHAACHAVGQSTAATVRLNAGIASGRVFCGWRGNDRRREYAVIGTTVNRAARLAALSTSEVICDDMTAHRLERRAHVESMGPVALKGTGEPAEVFRILDVGGTATGPAIERVQTTPLVGRVGERRRLKQSLDALTSGTGAGIVIRGDAGMGKSTLVAEFVRQAHDRQITIASGAGDSVIRSEPYRAWRTAMRGVLDALPRDGSVEATGIDGQIRIPAALADFAPLIADVLGLAAANNAVTSQLGAQARVEKTRDVVVEILRDVSARQPLGILLEDAHWLDSLSWELALAVRRRVPGVLLVIATRPVGAELEATLRQFTEQPETHVVDLSRLSFDEAHDLILRQLGVSRVPDALVRLVEARAAGYPLFIGELVGALRDAGIITVVGSSCIVPAGEGTLVAVALPDSVQAAIAARLDRLSADEQLTIKIASAIGFAFDLATIVDVHPLHPTAAALEATAQALEDRGFIDRSAADASMYVFRHAVVQDVAYGLMVSDQRRRLHRAVAERLAERFAADPPYALLAHHWIEAQDDQRSIECLEQAGARAASKGALQETARHFQQALEITERAAPIAGDEIRRARRLRYLGYALAELGDVKNGTMRLQQALTLLGQQGEPSRRALTVQLAREALTQLVSIAGMRRERVLPPVVREPLLEEAEILRMLGKLALFTQDHLAYAATSLRAMNLAEYTGAHATAASAYAALGYLASMFGLVRLGARWWRLADESGEIDARVNALSGRMIFLNAATRWDESDRVAETEERLIATTGYTAMIPTHLIIRQYSHLHQGRLPEGLQMASRFLDWALAQNNLQQTFAAHMHFIEIYLELGRLADAERHIAEAMPLVDRSDPMYVMIFRAHCLEARREAGDAAGAAAAAEELAALVEHTSPIIGGPMNGYVSLADYLIEQSRQLAATPAAERMQGRARTAYGALTQHARFLKYAQPRRWLLAGRLRTLGRSQRAGLRAWHRGLSLSKRFGMPRESARLHTELALSAPVGSNERAMHVSAARELYVGMGCLSRASALDNLASAVALR
jgi:class 3 adenylate cyclase